MSAHEQPDRREPRSRFDEIADLLVDALNEGNRRHEGGGSDDAPIAAEGGRQ